LGGAGTPSGVIVFGGYSTALDTTTVDGGLSCGISDFTTRAVHTVSVEDGQTTTDTHSEHSESLVYLLNTPGTAGDDRTLTDAAISGGIRFTPGESGTQYRILVIGVFAEGFSAFSAGSGTSTDATSVVAHGLTNAPKAGFYCYGVNNAGAATGARLSLGFHTDDGGIVQRSFGFNFRNGQTDGEENAQLQTDRVGFSVNQGAGTESTGWELTANDATNTTFTARTGSPGGDLIGGLFDLPNNDVFLGTVNSPNSTGTWNNSDLSFEPESIFGIITQAATADSAITDDPTAGTVSVFATDFTTEGSAAITDENAAATSDGASRQSTELWLGDDNQTEDYACNTFASDADGWTATCDTADAGTDLWPFLAIESLAGSSSISPLFYYLENN